MPFLLRLSAWIDALNQKIGQLLLWAIFTSVVISASNAIIRKAFSISSNAWLEIQWYLFAWSFLGAAAYTLLHNEHVRIDVISSRFSRRTQVWIDLACYVFMFFPMVWVVMDLSWPLFTKAWHSGEMSSNAGGLVRWPAYLAIPVGFALLAIQGVSECIKRVGFLLGVAPDPAQKAHEKTPEELLAEEIQRQRDAEQAALATSAGSTK